MLKHTVTFRMSTEKTRALDAIATAIDRDRSHVLNEAVDEYLEVRRWQMEHIEQGMLQSERGKFVSDKGVTAAFQKWRR